MLRTRWYATAGLAALFVCALIAVGCGDDDETTSAATTTTSTSADGTAAQKVDAAVQSCTETADQLSDAAAAGLKAACTTAGESAKQALSSGGEQAKQALSQAADSCNSSVAQLPAGESQDALKQLCDAIGAAAE